MMANPSPRIRCTQLDLTHTFNATYMARKYHDVATYKDEVVVFGGTVNERPGSFGLISPKSGSVKQFHATGSLPPPRTGHCMSSAILTNGLLGDVTPAQDATTGVLMIGGWRGAELKCAPNDVWFLDVVNLTWFRPRSEGQVPGCVNLGSLNTLKDRHAALYVGGDGVNFVSELYLYSLDTGMWQKPQVNGLVPPPRGAHSSAAVGVSDLVIFGGWNGHETLGDCWLWRGSARTWIQVDLTPSINVPGPRTDASLSNIDGKLVLLGGRGMWKRTHAEGLYMASLDDLDSEDKPQLCWEETNWSGKARIGHKAAVVDNVLVIVGGCEVSEGSSDLTLAEAVEYIVFGSQEGFTISKSIMTGKEKVPELNLFACAEWLSDVRFDVQGVVFPAHRLVLCLHSVVFRRMFTRGLHESSASPPNFPLRGPANTVPCVFEVFLRYLYSSDLPLAFLKQNLAPWSKGTDRDTFSSMITHILGTVKVDESLRLPADLEASVRITLAPSLLQTTWPADSLPYPTSCRRELRDFILAIFQLADEYMVSKLGTLCELILAHLVDDSSRMEVLQWAVVLKAASLVSFIEWVDRHPKPEARRLSAAVEDEAVKVLKAGAPDAVETTPPLPIAEHPEDLTLGFPTIADLVNVQSSFWGEAPHEASPPTTATSPATPDSEVQTERQRKGSAPVIPSNYFSATEERPREGADDDAVSEYTTLSEPDFAMKRECETLTIPIPSQVGGVSDRRQSDHSVVSNPHRTPTFDPASADVPDDFEVLPPAGVPPSNPARKLSQKLTGRLRRFKAGGNATGASPASNVSIKSDMSFTQRFKNKFKRPACA
eukprot:Blabericola_migrator_1__12490@NODE_78_length_15130_cov_126_174401_g70_i0_p2_GENE_NODE_78_length_15130_cov_126_174401_g70_i0NODE_78_length_15130_cov_126_174401_g70_i0_p2_ORF_typecomplete_len883_score103_04Kelch_3/PF13415_6/7_7e05Kelch_3/PF13415_6/0_00038Kelch_3/PF13415_6/2_1e06Kelch_3/PF13415_6/3_1e05Kelch_3/PF13415_6/29Kelch_3/PF13415_6/1_2e04Kelch_4/PF13418_6/50Kelch_4/PF13418_6/0_032Kelch_4/PF13418_6/2Kelch_4/PF13418_6/8_8e07Kelch_4/PF13418_6/8_9Kelch_4/PF13418_6/1_1Kelch_5/PF13854_6/12Kelch_5